MSERPAAGGIPAGASLQAAWPVLAFLVVNRLAGLRAAVAVATVLSLKLLVDRRRKGVALGTFMPLVTAAVVGRGVIGIVTDSEGVYFGLGIATKFGVALALAVSALIARPLAHHAAPHILQLTPSIIADRHFHTAMMGATIIGAAYYVTSGVFDVWLYQRSSLEGFVLIRFLANWPLSTAAIVAIAVVMNRQFAQIPGVSSVGDLLEARLAGYWPSIRESDT